MRAELAGAHPTPLDVLLVQPIVACWLAMQYADCAYAQKLAGGLSLAHAEHYQRQAERAQRRYLAAVKALATVRRLLTPAMQVNIADQQVNVAGTVEMGRWRPVVYPFGELDPNCMGTGKPIA